MSTKRYCFALDLMDDQKMIEEYEMYHRPDVIWPEIVEGIKQCNILDMEIFRAGNRLFMVLITNEMFDLEKDFERMLALPRQKEWAELMAKYQQRLPFARKNEHWVQMKQIFNLNT